MPDNQSVDAVLFDLDGTFADTAPDLAHALNTVLENHGRPGLELAQIRSVVSHGGRALIELGFGINDTHPDFEPLRQELLAVYRDDIARHTQLFPGIEDILIYIRSHGLKWGIVTNKPRWLTEPLMQGIDLPTKPDCIVSGDTLPQRKPDPEPLLHACRLIGCAPQKTVYVGDAERDIVAGKRAQMLTCVALFGYIGTEDTPDSWQADKTVNTPLEIIDWLKAHAG